MKYLTKNIYFWFSLIVSLLVGFWVWNNQLITGVPFFYIGNLDAIGGIENGFSLYSSVNLWEPTIQNSWVILVGSVYKIIRSLWINPFFIRWFFTSVILFFWFFSLKKLGQYFDKHISFWELILISIGFLFSTFTITFFEDYSFFVYLYWLLPLKFFVTIQEKRKSFPLPVLGFLYTFLAASINLPFALLTEWVAFLLLLVTKKTGKFIFKYGISAIFAIVLAILPSLIYTILNTDFTNFVLSSENFYRDATTLLSFVQGITDWGFFGQYNDMPNRSYAFLYKSLLGITTFLWLLVPIIVYLKNPQNKKQNTILFWGILLSSSLVIWPIIYFSGVIYDLFFSLPMSNIFRNNAKFFFAIYAGILLLLFFNKNRKIASVFFATTGIVTFGLMIFWKNMTPAKIHHIIPNDYQKIYEKNILSQNDRIVLFPQQYFPVYKWKKNIESHLWYSRPELFWKSEIILNRCMGCGNPIFATDRKWLLDIFSEEWKEKLKTYGITSIVYDNNVDASYYPKTLTLEKFQKLMRFYDFETYKKIGNIYVYDTGFETITHLTVCDAGWYRKQKNTYRKICKDKQITFITGDTDIYIPNSIAWLQLLLLCITLLVYFSYYNIWNRKK